MDIWIQPDIIEPLMLENYVYFPCKENEQKETETAIAKSEPQSCGDRVDSGYRAIRGVGLVRVQLYLLCC